MFFISYPVRVLADAVGVLQHGPDALHLRRGRQHRVSLGAHLGRHAARRQLLVPGSHGRAVDSWDLIDCIFPPPQALVLPARPNFNALGPSCDDGNTSHIPHRVFVGRPAEWSGLVQSGMMHTKNARGSMLVPPSPREGVSLFFLEISVFFIFPWGPEFLTNCHLIGKA